MGSTIPWTGPGFWTGLDSGLDSGKHVFLVLLLCQRGQGANAMPPGSPNTESCTHLLVIVPPTKCTYCTGEANTYLDMGDMDALASALHGVTVGTGRTQT